MKLLASSLVLGFLAAWHLGLSGKRLRTVGPRQYGLHRLYGILEPIILRIVDRIIAIRLLRDTRPGRRLLRLIAKACWFAPHGIVVTTEAAERMVDFVASAPGPGGGGRLAVGPCVCQFALNQWVEPSRKDVVLLYGADIYTHLQRGYEFVSAGEAKKKLRKFSQAGLVHELDFCLQSGQWTFVVCNCERDVCVLTRTFLLTGEFLWPGPQIVRQDRDRCIGVDQCGRCIERCLFGANTSDGGRAALDPIKGLGCGLCAADCPGGARTLVRRPDYRHDRRIPAELLLGDDG